MDKLKIKVDKKLFVFLLVLMIIGITMGSILVTILNSSDKNLTIEYINDFANNVKDNKLDYLFVLKNIHIQKAFLKSMKLLYLILQKELHLNQLLLYYSLCHFHIPTIPLTHPPKYNLQIYPQKENLIAYL